MAEKEKRRHPRIDSLNLMAFSCLDEEGNVVNQGMGRTLNVSAAGVLLETYYPVECENILLMDIGIKEDLVDLKGKVVHTRTSQEGKAETGIEFTEVDENASRVLRKYIDAFRIIYK